MFPVQFLADIRSAEGWSSANVIGMVVLIVVAVVLIALAIRVVTRR
jgi:hypothetical protein